MTLRIAWFSNPPAPDWGCSGYSSQTALVVPRLKSRLGHEVAILSSHHHGGGIVEWEGIPVYPVGRTRSSQDTIGPFSQHFKADITIGFLDAYVFDPDQWKGTPGLRFCPLFPVDHDPVPYPVLNIVGAPFTWQPLCYSRHGYRATCAAGLTPRYLPHGFDPLTHHRPEGESIAEIRRAARRKLGYPTEAYLRSKVGRDPFVVGMVAANNDPLPSRKAWAECFEGFAKFRKAVLADEPDAEVWLYVHSWMDGRVPLEQIAQMFGITRNMVKCPPVGQRLGFDGDWMRDTYASFDVLLSPSHGEGFSLALVESQATGTPVITGDWTAMTDVVRSGVVIEKSNAVRVLQEGLMSFQWFVQPQAVCDALVEMRRQTGERAQQLSDGALRVHDEYRIDDVIDRYWKPVLDELEGRVRRENAEEAIKAANKAMYSESGVTA